MFVDLNKNLANFPIARDANRKAEWRHRVDGSATCRIPGEDDIFLSVPEGHHRLLTAFDFNVLCLIAAHARDDDSPVVNLRSAKAALQQLGYAYDSTSLAKLKGSLAYLTTVSIKHRVWHVRGERFRKGKHWKYKRRTKTQLSLPPPLASVAGMRVALSDEWLPLLSASRYSVRMALPLPRDATTLNLVLLLAARAGALLKPTTRTGALFRKVGLLHSQRRPYLLASLEEAKSYFAKHGGVLRYKLQDYYHVELNLMNWLLPDGQP